MKSGGQAVVLDLRACKRFTVTRFARAQVRKEGLPPLFGCRQTTVQVQLLIRVEDTT